MTEINNSTSNKVLARNSLYNLLGQGLPILVALASMPMLVKTLGAERLGILSIAWMFIGYFSIFDFGLGRALTKLVAEKLGRDEREDVPHLIWTALALMTVLGCVGGIVLAAAAQYVTYNVLKIPAPLQRETLHSLYCIAFSIPLITTTAGLRGALEANQLFKGINVIRFFLGVSNYLAPLVVCLVSKNLFFIVLSLAIARFFSWFMHVCLCLKVYPILKTHLLYRQAFVKPLITFGGWMTAVNLCFPLLVYIERFVISAFLPVAYVAYYTTPYDMATKLWIIPGALTGTLLPAFSASSAVSNESAKALYQRVLRYILVCMFPISITIMAFSKEILFYWLGPEFSDNGTVVLQLITAGVFINSFAQVAFVLLQAFGRPDITFKILLVQIPFFIPLLIVMVKLYGINGAAVAWLIRVITDTIIFIVMSYKYSKISSGFIYATVIAAVSIVVTCGSIVFVQQLLERSVIYALFIAAYMLLAYKYCVTTDELSSIRSKLNRYLKI